MSLSSHHFSISSSLATKSTFGSTESKWLATFIFQSQCVNQGHYVYLFLSNVDRKGAIELRVKKKIRPIRKKFRDGRFEIKRYRGTTLVSCFAALWAGLEDTQLSQCNVRLVRFSLVSRFTRISVNSSGGMIDSSPMLASTVPSSLERGARNRPCLRRYL